MARLRRLWLLISLAGTALTVVGIVGLAAHLGTTHANAHTNAHTNAQTNARPPAGSPTSASAISSGAASQSPPESPAAFFAKFTAAVRTGDTSFLAARVDRAVISRYGAGQCVTAVRGLTDPTQQLRLLSASGPIQYAYVTDGISATVPDTFVFHVEGTAAGQAGARDYHFALDQGTFRLFLDCGTPLHR